MATPNLINVDTITPSVVVGAVTTSRVAVLDVTAELSAGAADTLLTSDGTDISWAASTAASKGFAIASAIVFG